MKKSTHKTNGKNYFSLDFTDLMGSLFLPNTFEPSSGQIQHPTLNLNMHWLAAQGRTEWICYVIPSWQKWVFLVLDFISVIVNWVSFFVHTFLISIQTIWWEICQWFWHVILIAYQRLISDVLLLFFKKIIIHVNCLRFPVCHYLYWD